MNVNAYYDGRFTNMESVRIPLSDRAYFFGDAVYDAVLGRNGKPFMITEHIARFNRSAALLGLEIPVTLHELTEIINKLIANFCGEYFFLYLQLSAKSEKRSHSRHPGCRSALLVTISEASDPLASKSAKLICAQDVRYSLCNIKTVNLLPAVLAATEAQKKGADEAVFIKDGTVTECAHSNIHIIKDGKLFTHPEGSAILSGISRGHLLGVCHRMKIPTYERPFTKSELFDADEVIITSTSKIARRVSEIDGKCFPICEGTLGFSICSKMLADFYDLTKPG